MAPDMTALKILLIGVRPAHNHAPHLVLFSDVPVPVSFPPRLTRTGLLVSTPCRALALGASCTVRSRRQIVSSHSLHG